MSVEHCTVDGAAIAYRDVGTGPAIVFVHGIYVTGAVWNDVVAELGEDFRCIVPTWPLGGHQPVGDEADLGAEAAAQRIVHFIEALDLHDVTVVANDTGGGLTLTALGDNTLDLSRIGGLVFTNSDNYEHFPPGAFRHIVTVCRRLPALGSAILRGLASGPGQRFFLSAVCRSEVDPVRRREVFGKFATDGRARREALRVTVSLDPALTMRAASAIEQFDRPVTLAWGTEDKLFPLADARRLADAFPHSRMVEIPNSSTYVMIDAPEQLAAEITIMAGPT